MSEATSTSTERSSARTNPKVYVACAIVVVVFGSLMFAAPRLIPSWDRYDWIIVATGAFAAMACSIPGVYLVLRRQSMMGDALSHTVLPGVVAAVLVTEWCKRSGWIPEASSDLIENAILFLGALLLGIFSAVMTEWVQKLGRVEASAALGVVFTTLFAIGLIMIRRAADIHIDMDCVLYGNIETAEFSHLLPLAIVFVMNVLLVVALFKELKIAAFDPSLATTMGIHARVMHYGLMAVTAATLVVAFERVGSILVIAMLIVPAATSYLLTNRLGPMIVVTLVFAALSALVGHMSAIVLPPIVFPRLGFDSLSEASASTSGMMAVVAGGFFGLTLLFSPRQGLVTRFFVRVQLALKIAQEDVLGQLYRKEESTSANDEIEAVDLMRSGAVVGPWLSKLALWRLKSSGQIEAVGTAYRLTEKGRGEARKLVRAHRLWESYMAEHFELPEDHLHDTAERVEHYIDPEIRKALAQELDLPIEDPHGKSIPHDDN